MLGNISSASHFFANQRHAYRGVDAGAVGSMQPQSLPQISTQSPNSSTAPSDSSPPSLFKPVDNVTKASELSPGAGNDLRSTSLAPTYEQARGQAQKNEIEQRKQAQDQALISQLAARDREVRAHEQAHMAVGGAYAGAAKYHYQRGPDGVSYAVGGEVPIDVSKEANPEQTIRKAQIVRRAALAPAEPSPQDRLVAAEASRMEMQARQDLSLELRQQQAAEKLEGTESEGADNNTAVAGSGMGKTRSPAASTNAIAAESSNSSEPSINEPRAEQNARPVSRLYSSIESSLYQQAGAGKLLDEHA